MVLVGDRERAAGREREPIMCVRARACARVCASRIRHKSKYKHN